LFLVTGFSAFSQSCSMNFTNPDINTTTMKFRVTLNIVSTSTTAWQLGNHNLRFNYPVNCLSTPVIAQNNLPGTGFTYGTPTTTGSNLSTGVMSYNVTLPSGTAGQVVNTTTGFDIMIIEWNITNLAGLSDPANKLQWRNPTTFANPRLAIVTSTQTTGCPAGCTLTYTSTPDLAPLPVEFKSFTGKANGTVNTFRWELASQKNVSHFILERSIDGVNGFRRVSDNIKGAGNTNQLMAYTTDDKSPISRGFYRLASYDLDNSVTYSAVISVDRRESRFGIVEISPNPTSGQLRVNYEATQNASYSIQISDALGRIVKATNIEAVKGNNNANIDITELPVGTYYLVLNGSDHHSVEKIVKQ